MGKVLLGTSYLRKKLADKTFQIYCFIKMCDK